MMLGVVSLTYVGLRTNFSYCTVWQIYRTLGLLSRIDVDCMHMMAPGFIHSFITARQHTSLLC